MNFIVLIIVLICLIRYYQKTIVAIAPLMVFLSMLTIPFLNLTTISLADLILIIAVILFPFHYSLKEIKEYPFHICTLVMVIAFWGSNYWGYEKRWFLSTAKILTIYVYPMILWVCLKNTKLIKIFEKSMLVFGTILITYAFFEAVSFTNPILEFLKKQNELMDTVMVTYQYRFGVKRLQSFLPLFDAFGYTAASFALIMLYLKMYTQRTTMNKQYIVVLAVALFIGVLLTGTRAVIASTLIGSLIFYETIKKYYKVFICMLPIVLFLGYTSSFLSDIIRSFSDTQSVGGSNSDMRMEQLTISLYYFFQNPIFGNGPTFTFTVAKQMDEGLLGAESVWFVYLIDYGAVGCISLLITILYPIGYMIKKRMYPFIFLVLMFITNKTLSSMPGISEGYFLIYIVFLIRNEKINNTIKDITTLLKLKNAKAFNNNTNL